MATDPNAAIRQAFQKIGIDGVDDDVLRKCASLSKSADVAPSKLADSWEAFSLNKKITTLDETSFKAFRKQVIKDSDVPMVDEENGAVMTRPKRQAAHVITPSSNGKKRSATATPFDSTPNNNAKSASRISMSPQRSPAVRTPSTRPLYSEQRKDAGKEVASYNPNNILSVPASTTNKTRCVVSSSSFPSNVPTPYRHMFTVLEERSLQLNKMIEEKQKEFSEKFNFGTDQIAELQPVGIPLQDTICCIGRICNSASEGRLNAASVLLEGSRSSSNGTRVEVDLTHMKSQNLSYSLFPGQIVAVEGVNTSGRKMVAHRICDGAAHPAPKSTVGELLQFHHDDSHQGGNPLKIMAAAGPFTSAENLEYEPFFDLLNETVQEGPDVVILVGPFVDMRHKSIASGGPVLKFENDDGDLIVSNEMIFKEKIAALLQDLFENDATLHTHVVLVPSLNDATAEWVYPQAPFTDKRPGGGMRSDFLGEGGFSLGSHGLYEINTKSDQRIHCVSNPCTLKINEVTVGVTATDAIMHMSGNEISHNLQGSRLARLMQHMLQQRSYCPLSPAPINLNLKQADQWKIPCGLDLLLSPSKLVTFARPVLEGETLAINPGELTKDTVGGTYAIIDVHPMARETLDAAGGPQVELKHNIAERTTVSIKKI